MKTGRTPHTVYRTVPKKPSFSAENHKKVPKKACGCWRYVAAFCVRSVSLVADNEDACCCFYDVIGDCFELVDLEDACDLWE